jgi:hypothetical protein
MKQEFVPYELALELKQLGFDEPCLAYHNIDPYLKSPAFNLCKPFDHEWCLPAPLYQQAFRWFREKHNVSHFDLLVMHFYELKNPYEKAELACLTRLIEIVKTKTE